MHQDIVSNPNKNTIFLVYNFKQNASLADKKAAFAATCKLVLNLNNSAAARMLEARTKSSVVLGVGVEIWDELGLGAKPEQFEKFQQIKGAKHTAVSTRGDLHFHIRSEEFSLCIDMATSIANVLEGVADRVEEVHGFRYWDGRSILGFVDGTENPQGKDRVKFGVISETGFEGASYLFVQKYIHDMKSWNAMSVEAQEKVIGRSKADDIEMSDEQKPANSHSARANVGDDNKIVRDNMPFRNPNTGEIGTYFISYASSFKITKMMLQSMFVGVPEGNYDRILDFSVPKTGTLFLAPSLEMLKGFSELV